MLQSLHVNIIKYLRLIPNPFFVYRFQRAYTVQREQERLRKSLAKYNNFVREKAAKVEDGDRLYEEEVEFQESIEQRIREKTNLVQELDGAKDFLNSAVERRAIFRRYLDTVVEEERANRNRYIF